MTTAQRDVITLNDDWENKKSDLAATLTARRPMAVLIQEGKNNVYTRLLRRFVAKLKKRAKPVTWPAHYKVAQITTNKGTAGVAVVWDSTKFHKNSGPHHEVLCEPHGKKIEPRGVTWIRGYPIAADGSHGPVMILASAHRPPLRFKALWAEFDANLKKWVHSRQVPVVFGMDTNTHGFKALGKKYGVHVAGHRIDAVFASAPLTLGAVTVLAKRTSDHRAVKVPVRWTHPPKKR